MSRPMTETELLTLPLNVDLVTAGRALGLGRNLSYELARTNKFPCRVIPAGTRFRVPRAELLRVLGIDPADARSAEDQAAAVG
jgi:hypothetical protein